MAEISLIIGIAIGAAGAWLVLRSRVRDEHQLGDSFKALASEALNSNNQQFVALAAHDGAERIIEKNESVLFILDEDGVGNGVDDVRQELACKEHGGDVGSVRRKLRRPARLTGGGTGASDVAVA